MIEGFRLLGRKRLVMERCVGERCMGKWAALVMMGLGGATAAIGQTAGGGTQGCAALSKLGTPQIEIVQAAAVEAGTLDGASTQSSRGDGELVRLEAVRGDQEVVRGHVGHRDRDQGRERVQQLE